MTWPGAKHRALGCLLQWCPPGHFDSMCEPFWGTGALTLALADRIRGPVFAAERQPSLRCWWHWLLSEPEELFAEIERQRVRWQAAARDRAVFDELRSTWNRLHRTDPGGLLTSAMLWCLVYQSTNNMVRFNRSGEYNQTWGQGRAVPSPRAVIADDTLRRIRLLAPRLVLREDFTAALDEFLACVDEGHSGVCYLDPPYILDTTMYAAGEWRLASLGRLMHYIEGLEERGVWWLYTDYAAKAGEVHPYSRALARFRSVPVRTTKDARPRGSSQSRDERLWVGSCVEPQPAPAVAVQ